MGDLVGGDGRQNETTRTALAELSGSSVAGEGFLGSAYPARTTAAPRAELRIGIAMGIRVGRTIARNVGAPEPLVKDERRRPGRHRSASRSATVRTLAFTRGAPVFASKNGDGLPCLVTFHRRS